MTSRERLHRLHTQKEVDRPGLFIRGVSQTEPPHESYEALRNYVCEHGDLKDIIGVRWYLEGHDIETECVPHSIDYVKIISTLRTPSGNLTHERLEGLRGLPEYDTKHYIETEEDAEKFLSTPPPVLPPLDANYFNARVNKMGEHGIVVVQFPNPLSYITYLLGSELFALWSIDHRELLHEMIARERDGLLEYIKSCIDAGIGPYFATQGQEFLTPPLHGAADFYDFNVRYDKPIADLIHNANGYLHVHCHGPLKNVLPYFLEIGADIEHPIEPPPMGDVTPAEAKAVFRGKACIEGNIQIGDMYDCEPDEIREQVKTLIRDAFDDRRGLIVCPTASPYIPRAGNCIANYKVMMDAVLEF